MNFNELKSTDSIFQRNDRTGLRYRKRYAKENSGTWSEGSSGWKWSGDKPAATPKVSKPVTTPKISPKIDLS